MISEQQYKEMLKKTSVILKVLPTSKNIEEISKKTDLTTSTIQRYLNRKDLIKGVLQNEKLEQEAYQMIQEWLKNAKVEGNKKGGKISQEMYQYSKKDDGKFSGNNRKSH